MKTGYSYRDAQLILKKYWGYEDFRPGQASLVRALLLGRDVLGVMPTGAGKSICYQVPALLFPGMTIIVSPLISLMEDQVDALNARGIPAAAINSLHPLRRLPFADKLRQGNLQQIEKNSSDHPDVLPPGIPKIIYVSPERLQSADFRRFLSGIPVSFLCVDEAHCISKWGHDFRPEYLKIHDFINFLKQASFSGFIGNFPLHIAAFTATADAHIRKEILTELNLQRPFCLTTGFDRPNLYFAVEHPRKKHEALYRHIARHPGECGIIYCSTRRTVERVAADLQRHGIRAEKYHAGMPSEERTAVQNRFMKGETPIVAATNAFGMGVDKPDVRFVIHFDMPKDMESYYQEAGRAGRDGFPSECILLYSPKDVKLGRLFIERNLPAARVGQKSPAARVGQKSPAAPVGQKSPAAPVGQKSPAAPVKQSLSSAQRNSSGAQKGSGAAHKKSNDAQIPESLRLHRDSEFERLRSMVYYAAGRVCLRAFMLEYFGEHAPSYCGNCSVCLAGTLPVNPDSREELLHGGVLRVPDQSLTGAGSHRHIPKNSSHGTDYQHHIPQDARPGIGFQRHVPQETRPGIEYHQPVLLDASPGTRYHHPVPQEASPRTSFHNRNRVAGQFLQESSQLTSREYELYRSLLKVRGRIAKDKSVSPEKIFPDRILRSLCRALPLTIPQMLMIDNISVIKVLRCGKPFLKEIADYCYFYKIKI